MHGAPPSGCLAGGKRLVSEAVVLLPRELAKLRPKLLGAASEDGEEASGLMLRTGMCEAYDEVWEAQPVSRPVEGDSWW
jgi:hypothetical protein